MGTVYRDAVSGEYVTQEYAARHPRTTVSETTDYTNDDTVEMPAVETTQPEQE